MIIETSAPTRVDLSGGTIDIWPLYLFHPNAVTVNFAVDLTARCRLSTRKDGRIELRSVDTRKSAGFDGLEALGRDQELPLLSRAAAFFRPAQGFEMVTECTAPAGSGLAGSSALDVAICGALNHLTDGGLGLESLISVAKNIEAQVIRVPTGDQDYYPAAYGGLQAVHLSAGGVRREEIGADLDRLSQRLVLVFSGRQRNSGINNWDVMKRHIDGDPGITRAFDRIVSASNRVLEAIRSGNFDDMDDAIEEEWANRRALCEGIGTPEIERIVELARRSGARSAKVCGAGGGGCVLIGGPDGCRSRIERKLREDRIEVIDYRISRRGLEITAGAMAGGAARSL